MDEYSARFCVRATSHGGGATSGTKCGRWNPTNEQVKVLTQLFRSGLRTPSTDQIQRISMQLSCYGKIENKNVFYWFQNHKARERHKRRRVLIHDEGNDEIIHNPREITKFYSAKDFGECDIVSVSERVTHQTLQLFPIKSLNEADKEKLKLFGNDCNEKWPLAYNSTTEMDHLTLDLQLSFT